ncbi:MAG: hypothetical protein O2964_18130 [Verrucomicrobia bacterium]|nr:hypothetical protein [Verrucomicrobiota bacterium]
MKSTVFSSSNRSLSHWRFNASLLIGLLALSQVQGQEILFQETFETDGDGSRYTIEGGDVFEVDRIQSELGILDQQGPIYWSRNTDVSFVGVPAPTPEKRGILAYHHTIAADDVTEDFLSFFDGIVDWMTGGKSNATILFSPPPAGDGDFVLVERLESKGHTVLEDDEGGDLPSPSEIDAVIKSSSGGTNPSRFAIYEVPLLTFGAPDHDDMLVSSIGQTITTDIGPVTFHNTGHPTAGDMTGEKTFINNSNQFDLAGEIFPGNATVVASFTRTIAASVDSIEEAQQVINGEIKNRKSTGTLPEADIVAAGNAASGGIFSGDFAAPGNPAGGFVTVAKGQIRIGSADTISVALGADDGGYVRIDLDGNGISADDQVLTLDGTGAFRYTTADVDFPAGTFDFEWVAYNSSGAFGSEFLTAFSAGGGTPTTIDDFEWEPVSDISGAITLVGDIDVTTYAMDVPPEQETVPFFIALEAPEDGGSVFGGGPFAGFEGNAFFAGSGLNKFDAGVLPKTITWNAPINVAGKENLNLTIAAAATFLDFETSDFLRVYIDDGNPLIDFTAPSGNDKYFNDQGTNGENPTRLNLNFQDITYPIPAGTSTINLRIESTTTWWNEIVGIDNIRITSGELQTVEPTVSIAREGDNIVVSWTGTLQSAADINGPWVDVADDTNSPIVIAPDDQLPMQFGRAVAP